MTALNTTVRPLQYHHCQHFNFGMLKAPDSICLLI